jgi:hypothetical protein
VAASAPVDRRKLTAEAKPDGRVLVTIPPVVDNRPPFRDKFEKKKRWMSRGGGY